MIIEIQRLGNRKNQNIKNSQKSIAQNYKNDNTYIYIYLNRMVSHLLEVKSDQGVVIIKQFNFTFIFLIDQVLIKFKKQNYFFNF